jgi:hypothetical protein
VARPERSLPDAEPGQDGVYGLLTGDRKQIKPEGFDKVHARGHARGQATHGEVRWDPVPIQPEVLTLRPNGNSKNGHNGNGRNGTNG